MSYRELARSSGPWFLLLGLAARLPYAMLPLATLLWLRGGGVSFTQAGVVAAAQSIAIAGGGLLVGRLADRHGPRRVGVVAALLNATAVAVMIVAGPKAWPVAVLAGLTQPQVGPLARVHWALSRPDLLPVALSFEAAADELSFILGPVIAGLPIMLLLVLGAALPFALRYDRRRPERLSDKVISWRSIVVLVGAMAAVGMIFGAVQTGVAARGATGLYALLGVGSGLGGLLSGWIRLPQKVSAAALLVGMVTFTVLPLPVAMVVGGATIAPFMVSLFVAAERRAGGRLGTVIATLSAGGPVGTAGGQLVAGWLTDHYGPAGAFVVAPVAAVVCCLVICL
ncbi:MFS transporter [Kutzneria sp. CA-103260]|uniref:MFS transporter n=1 Tax=Kutzneria sp. CA-103260 TaxID=2802641 RepID=UPI001BA6C7BF|nr:MFS transporter [Kutzneria sp. CA-103260]QUQ63524.1 Major Facilitator Superfamily protein [Kutzneria sp. CA-103260]